MSNKIEKRIFKKIKVNYENNRKFIEENLIKYGEKKYEGEFLELMKNGYLQMADINLELSQAIDFSNTTKKYKFDDISEYEKWLCGVWEFKWQLW